MGFNEQLIRKVPLAHELCKALITAAAVLRMDLNFLSLCLDKCPHEYVIFSGAVVIGE